jgi:hypothetical protein
MDQAILKDLERRLENWGRWSRSGGRAAGTSSTYKVMRALGYRPEYGEEAAPAVDARDAEVVNAAIASFGRCPETDLLVQVYVYRAADRRRACRLAGVRTRKFDFFLQRAYRRLISALYRDIM